MHLDNNFAHLSAVDAGVEPLLGFSVEGCDDWYLWTIASRSCLLLSIIASSSSDSMSTSITLYTVLIIIMVVQFYQKGFLPRCTYTKKISGRIVLLLMPSCSSWFLTITHTYVPYTKTYTISYVRLHGNATQWDDRQTNNVKYYRGAYTCPQIHFSPPVHHSTHLCHVYLWIVIFAPSYNEGKYLFGDYYM